MIGKRIYVFLLLMLVSLSSVFCDNSLLSETNFNIILNKIGASRIIFCEVDSVGGIDENTEINEVAFDRYETPNSGQSFSTSIQFGIYMDIYPASTSVSSSTLNVDLVFSCDSNYSVETGMLRGAKLSSDNDVILLNYDVAVDTDKKITGSNDLTAGLSYAQRSVTLLSDTIIPNSGLKKEYVCTLTIKEDGTDSNSIIMDNIYSGLAILLVKID